MNDGKTPPGLSAMRRCAASGACTTCRNSTADGRGVFMTRPTETAQDASIVVASNEIARPKS